MVGSGAGANFDGQRKVREVREKSGTTNARRRNPGHLRFVRRKNQLQNPRWPQRFGAIFGSARSEGNGKQQRRSPQPKRRRTRRNPAGRRRS